MGGVYDDVVWAMHPTDLNDDGVAQAGELLNLVKGGDLSDASHKAPCYGHNVNNAIQTYQNQETRFLTGQTFTAYHVGNTVVDGRYFHGNARLTPVMSALRDFTKTEITGIFRVRCSDVRKNSSWVLNMGSLELGFNNNSVRVYRSGDQLPTSGSSKSRILVESDKWIDLAFVASNYTVQVEGRAVSTGAIHVVCAYVGVGTAEQPYLTADCTCLPPLPTAASEWYLGTETLVTVAQTDAYKNSKFFEGDIAQAAFWDRALSDEEILEVFRTPQAPAGVQKGYANADNSEFGGAAGVSLDWDASDWRLFPSTLAAGDSFTLTRTLSAEDFAQPRRFVLHTVAGVGRLSVSVNGGEPVVAELDAQGSGEVFFPRTSFVAGNNTLVVTRVDGGSVSWGVDAFVFDVGQAEMVRTYAEDAAVEDSLSVPLDTYLTIDVAEGKTVVWRGKVSGPGGLRKKGAGVLVMAAADNAYTGGTEVLGGVLETCSLNAATTPLGSGDVVIDQAAGAQLAVATTLANNLIFQGASTRMRPGLHFADISVLNGNVSALDDLHFSTAWADDVTARDIVKVTFAGEVNIATGARLAAAPHCRVDFAGKLTTDTLEGYYVDNAANVPVSLCKTQGNLGSFIISSTGNTIGTICLDQTRFICGRTNFSGNFKLAFTGEHLADGWGYFDINGQTISYVCGLSTPVLTSESEGCQVINSSSTRGLFRFKMGIGDCYAKFDGAMDFEIVTPVTFRARHNTMSGEVMAHSAVVFDGCTFSNMTAYASDTGYATDFSGMPDGALAGLKTLGSGSSFTYRLRAGVFTPRQVTLKLLGWNADAGTPSDALYVEGDEAFEVLSLLYKKADENVSVTAPIGSYTGVADGSGEVFSLRQGDVKVFTGGTPTTIVYTGSGADFMDPASWSDEEGSALTTPPDFSMPYFAVVLDNTTLTLPDGEMFLGGLTLRNGATVNGAAGSKLSLYGSVTVADALDAGTDYVFNVPVQLGVDVEFAIPSNGTLAVNAGVRGVGNLTLDGRQQKGGFEQEGTSFKGRVLGGAFTLQGDSSWSGDLVMRRGSLLLTGTLGSVGDKGKFTSYGSYDKAPHYFANTVVSNLVCHKRILPQSVGSTPDNVNNHSQFVYAPGTTNVFNGEFDYSASNDLYLETDTQLVFNGPYLCGNTQQFIAQNGSERTSIIFNGPMQVGYSKVNKGRVTFNGKGQGFSVTFNASECTTESSLNFCGNVVAEMNADNVFTSIGSYFQLGDGASVLKLNGVVFTVDQPRLYASAKVTGSEGSVFRVTGGSTASGGSYLWSPFKDAVSLSIDATNTVWMVGGASTTTGSLMVSRGTLDVDSAGKGASWLHGPEVGVEGTGRLVLHSAPFAADRAVLSVADGGVIESCAGVRQGFVGGTLNGVRLPNGRYTQAEAKALAGHLAGAGAIRLGTSGVTLLIR
ncbi:MAG: hypothetical protein MJ240_03720 [Kiritimatiellae bacterium]|nr:hypothetical protein [Kiritimatiellia bacterium]